MKKKDELKKVSISYNPKDGSIRLGSKDPRIQGQPFYLEVPSGSPTYQTLFNLLDKDDITQDLYPKLCAINRKTILEFYYTHTSREIHIGTNGDHSQAIIDLNDVPHTIITGCTGSGKSVLQRSIYTTALFKEYANIYFFDLKQIEIPKYVQTGKSRIATTEPEALKLITDTTHILENRARTKHQPPQWKPLYIMIDEYAMIRQSSIGEEFSQTLQIILEQGAKYGIYVFLGTMQPQLCKIEEVLTYFSRQIITGREDRETYELIFKNPAEYRAGLFRGRDEKFDEDKFLEGIDQPKLTPAGRMIVNTHGKQELVQMGFIAEEEESELLIKEIHNSPKAEISLDEYDTLNS